MAQTGARADSAQNPLSLSDLDTSDGDPRILDLRIAALLGFERPRDIRKLIERNRDELEAYGEVCATVAQTSEIGGRPGKEYWLNEPQALLVCIRSDAPNAPDVRRQLITVFIAWRWGQLPTAKPARLSLRDMDRARLLVAECRHLHGAAAARALWRDLGLPGPAPDQPARPALAARLTPGLGLMLTEAGTILFDTRDTRVQGGEQVLAIVPEKIGQTPRLEVFEAADGRDRFSGQPHGDRTVLWADPPRYVAALGETIQTHRYCTVIGRIIDVIPLSEGRP